MGGRVVLGRRHFTRTFRRETGPAIHGYLTVEAVAAAVGFSDGRQIRRLWNRRFGTTPRGNSESPTTGP